jgi:hypothetical protein
MATVDEVLAALRNNQTPPTDDRVWILVEIDPRTGARSWTTHNLAAAAAGEVLFSVSLDLHDRARQEQASAPRAP